MPTSWLGPCYRGSFRSSKEHREIRSSLTRLKNTLVLGTSRSDLCFGETHPARDTCSAVHPGFVPTTKAWLGKDLDEILFWRKVHLLQKVSRTCWKVPHTIQESRPMRKEPAVPVRAEPTCRVVTPGLQEGMSGNGLSIWQFLYSFDRVILCFLEMTSNTLDLSYGEALTAGTLGADGVALPVFTSSCRPSPCASP